MALPNVHVAFKNNPSGSGWYVDGKGWQQSVRHPNTDEDDILLPGYLCDSTWSDLDILLGALCTVQHCKLFRTTTPETLPYEDDNYIPDYIDQISGNAMRDTSFGLSQKELEVLGEFNMVHLSFDYMLDNLSGPTAQMLRYERYVNWCQCYEDEFFERLIGYGPPEALTDIEFYHSASLELIPCGYGAAAPKLDKSLKPAYEFEIGFYDRYRGLCAYNKRAWRRSCEIDDLLYPEDPTALYIGSLAGCYKERGIPRSMSKEYRHCISTEIADGEYSMLKRDHLHKERLPTRCHEWIAGADCTAL